MDNEPATPINGHTPKDQEYRIIDGSTVEQWSTWAGFWDVAYEAPGKADAERYVREHERNETHQYTIAGVDREIGAIGIMVPFKSVDIRATSVEDAANQTVEFRRSLDREHIMVCAVVRQYDAERVGRLANSYWLARADKDGTIVDDEGKIHNGRMAQQISDEMTRSIKELSDQNRAALLRTGIGEALASTASDKPIEIDGYQLRWRGGTFGDGYDIDAAVKPGRMIDEWTNGFRWVWTDDQRVIFTYCEGDLTGQLFFTYDAYQAGMASAAEFYAGDIA